MDIPLHLIDPPKVLLREVRKESDVYQDLLRTIPINGVLQSVVLRPRGDRYELVDGNYRLTASKELHRETIPAEVRELSDVEALCVQVQTNSIRAETTTLEYAKQLLRIQHAMPELPMPQLARMVGKSPYWVKQQLSLLTLSPKVQAMIDRGHMRLLNAYQLAKLPSHLQPRLINDAQELPPAEFRELVGQKIKDLQMSARDRSEERRASQDSAFHPYLRPIKDLINETQTRRAAAAVIVEARPANVLDAFALGVKWALHIDPLTLSQRKDNFDNS